MFSGNHRPDTSEVVELCIINDLQICFQAKTSPSNSFQFGVVEYMQGSKTGGPAWAEGWHGLKARVTVANTPEMKRLFLFLRGCSRARRRLTAASEKQTRKLTHG